MRHKNQKETQRQEIIKLAMNDFELFCKLFIKIKTKSSQISPFIFNTEQHYIHSKIQEQLKAKGLVRTIIVKSRQVGITTYCSARVLHNAMYNFGKNSAFIGNYNTVVENIRNNISNYMASINKNLKPELEINNSNHMQFKGLQSGISFFTSGTSSVGRSNTLHYLHGTEVAYWQNDHETIASLFNAIPYTKGTEIILESTSKGAYGVFYKLIKQALNKEIDFQVLFLPWFWQSQYSLSSNQLQGLNLKADSVWLSYQQKNSLNNNQLFWAIKTNNLLAGANHKAEGPCNAFKNEFPASLEEAISSYKNNSFITQESVYKITNKKENFKEIKPHAMVLGVDVARQGKDYSYIIDRTDNCIGYFVNLKLKTNSLMELCGVIVNLINKYNICKVCIDTIGLGAGVYDRLVELGYQDLLVAVNVASKANNGEKYLNKKAELWSFFKDFIENKAQFLIDDENLKSQILATNAFYNSFGRLQIEAKKNLKSSLWSSTDAADAAVLTFATNYFKSITVQNTNEIVVY